LAEVVVTVVVEVASARVTVVVERNVVGVWVNGSPLGVRNTSNTQERHNQRNNTTSCVETSTHDEQVLLVELTVAVEHPELGEATGKEGWDNQNLVTSWSNKLEENWEVDVVPVLGLDKELVTQPWENWAKGTNQEAPQSGSIDGTNTEETLWADSSPNTTSRVEDSVVVHVPVDTLDVEQTTRAESHVPNSGGRDNNVNESSKELGGNHGVWWNVHVLTNLQVSRQVESLEQVVGSPRLEGHDSDSLTWDHQSNDELRHDVQVQTNTSDGSNGSVWNDKESNHEKIEENTPPWHVEWCENGD